MNGWQKTWFVFSSIWLIFCVLVGLIDGGLFGGFIVGIAIPALLYVIRLAFVWLFK